MVTLSRTQLRFHFVNSGSPHCVIFFDENKNLATTLEEVDVYGLGKEIRNHGYFFPEGTNVNFVEEKDATNFFVRTYERGVEEETLACGTGSVAVALIINQVKRSLSPVTLHVRSGELLTVGFDRTSDGVYHDVTLSGSAHVVFSGIIKYEFSSQSIVDIV
jgi:diaminopimelate epimerase